MKIELTVQEFQELTALMLWEPVLSKADLIITQRIAEMNVLVEQLVAAVSAQTTQSEGLRVIVQTAISEMTNLKAALTNAIANASSLSEEDAATLQAVIDSAGTDSALDAAAAQALADAVAVNAVTN